MIADQNFYDMFYIFFILRLRLRPMVKIAPKVQHCELPVVQCVFREICPPQDLYTTILLTILQCPVCKGRLIILSVKRKY